MTFHMEAFSDPRLPARFWAKVDPRSSQEATA